MADNYTKSGSSGPSYTVGGKPITGYTVGGHAASGYTVGGQPAEHYTGGEPTHFSGSSGSSAFQQSLHNAMAARYSGHDSGNVFTNAVEQGFVTASGIPNAVTGTTEAAWHSLHLGYTNKAEAGWSPEKNWQALLSMFGLGHAGDKYNQIVPDRSVPASERGFGGLASSEWWHDPKQFGGAALTPQYEAVKSDVNAARRGDWHYFEKNPLNPILDLATVGSLGGGAALKLAAAGRLGESARAIATTERLIRSGDTEEALNQARTLQGRIRQRVYDNWRMKPENADLPLVGANTAIKKILDRRANNDTIRAGLPVREFQRITKDLTPAERDAVHIIAEPVTLSDRISYYKGRELEIVADLGKRAARLLKHPPKTRARMPPGLRNIRVYLAKIEDPAVRAAIENPSPALVKAVWAAYDLEKKAGRTLENAGAITQEARDIRTELPAREMTPPTPPPGAAGSAATPPTGPMHGPPTPPWIGASTRPPSVFPGGPPTFVLRITRNFFDDYMKRGGHPDDAYIQANKARGNIIPVRMNRVALKHMLAEAEKDGKSSARATIRRIQGQMAKIDKTEAKTARSLPWKRDAKTGSSYIPGSDYHVDPIHQTGEWEARKGNEGLGVYHELSHAKDRIERHAEMLRKEEAALGHATSPGSEAPGLAAESFTEPTPVAAASPERAALEAQINDLGTKLDAAERRLTRTNDAEEAAKLHSLIEKGRAKQNRLIEEEARIARGVPEEQRIGTEPSVTEPPPENPMRSSEDVTRHVLERAGYSPEDVARAVESQRGELYRYTRNNGDTVEVRAKNMAEARRLVREKMGVRTLQKRFGTIEKVSEPLSDARELPPMSGGSLGSLRNVHGDVYPPNFRFPHMREGVGAGDFIPRGTERLLGKIPLPRQLRRNEAFLLRNALFLTDPEMVYTRDYLSTMRWASLNNMQRLSLLPISQELSLADANTGFKKPREWYFRPSFDAKTTVPIPREVKFAEPLNADRMSLDTGAVRRGLEDAKNRIVDEHNFEKLMTPEELAAWRREKARLTPDERDAYTLETMNRLGIRRVPAAFGKDFSKEFGGTSRAMRILVDRPLDAWRVITLNYRPAWAVNNFVGNALMGLARYGAPGAAAYLHVLLSAERGPDKVLQLWKYTMKVPTLQRKYGEAFREVAPWLHSAGLYGTQSRITHKGIYSGYGEEQVARLKANPAWKAAGLTARTVTYPLRKFSHGLVRAEILLAEDTGREAAFLRESGADIARIKENARLAGEANLSTIEALKRMDRKSVELATERVNTWLGDFNGMGVTERRWMRRFIPFYSWFKVITKVTGHYIATYPARVLLLKNIEEALNTQGEPALPAWLQGSVLIGGPSQKGVQTLVSTQGLNPYETLPQIAQGGLGGIQNPFLTAAVIGESGRDPAFGSLQDYLGPGSTKKAGWEGQLERMGGAFFGGLGPVRVEQQATGPYKGKLYSPKTYAHVGPLSVNDFLLQYLGLPVRHVNVAEAKRERGLR